jgi:hypothetical protein
MDTASRHFIKACEQQDVQLNEKVIADLGFLKGDIRWTASEIYSSPMVRTIQEWAWVAETNDAGSPDHQIANKPIMVDQLPSDPIMRMLAGIANAALRERVPSVYEPIEHPGLVWNVCRDVESHWNEVFNRIASKHKHPRPRIELFTDGDTIVAIRKAIGHPTGILLRPQRLGQLDYVYPAGSLIQLQTRHDAQGRHIAWEKTRSAPKRTSWSDVTTVSFSRPSVYATSGVYRRRHFGIHERTQNSACMKRIHRLAKTALRYSEF